MVVELADLACYLSDLPSSEAVALIQRGSMALLEFPKASVGVKGAAEVGLFNNVWAPFNLVVFGG